jgi:hypothetical protein
MRGGHTTGWPVRPRGEKRPHEEPPGHRRSGVPRTHGCAVQLTEQGKGELNSLWSCQGHNICSLDRWSSCRHEQGGRAEGTV